MLRKTLPAMAAALALIATATPAGAEPPADEPATFDGLDAFIDEHVSQTMAAENIPGAAVTVASSEGTIYNEGFGVSDVAAGTPVEAERTVFLVGSQAKMFTAQAALQLVDAGKLDLDTDVNEYLPDFQIDDTYPGEPVTLRHLLTHTAGFDEDYQIGAGSGEPEDFDELGAHLAATQPERVKAPGSAVTYNNYALGLAGYLVEIASGQSYGDYLSEQVFAPLEMGSSTAAVPRPQELEKRRAISHSPDLVPIDITYGETAPTGIGPAATPADMGRYMSAQLARDPRLGDGVAEQMQTQQYTEDDDLPGMGFIFEESTHQGHRMLFKGGDMPGTHSFMFLLPEADIAVNVVSNGSGEGGHGVDGFELIHKIIDQYLPEEPLPSSEPLPDADAGEYEGWYLNSRTSHNSFAKLRGILSSTPIQVTAAADGGIVTGGFMDGTHWTQVEPGEFQADDGFERIVFRDDGGFAVGNSTVVFDKLGTLDHPYLHLTVLLLGVVVLGLSLIALPLLALARRIRRRPRHELPARLARLTAWVTAVMAIGFIVSLLMLGTDQTALIVPVWEGTATLLVPLSMAAMTVPLAVAVVACGGVAWFRRWWRLPGRIGYSLIAVGAVAFASFAVTYNLVPPFT